MLEKALVLDGDERVDHVLRDVLIVDPDALVLPGEGDKLLILAGGILIPDRARFRELVVLQREVHLRGEEVFDVIGENAGEQQRAGQENQQHRADDLQNRADDTGRRVHGEARRAGDMPTGAVRFFNAV